MSGTAASGSGGAAASSLSVQRGALPASAIERLNQATGLAHIAVLATAVNLVHFRYTGLGECDIKMRLSAVDPETGAVGAGAAFSCVYKRGHTMRDAFDHTAQQIKAAVDAIDEKEKASRLPLLDASARPPFCIELFQLISAELASSGFQHLCHITINATVAAATAASSAGGGKKKKAAAAAAAAAATAGSASYNARYEFPPMLTAGQADPRLRVSQHLPCMLEELAKLATDDLGSSASASSISAAAAASALPAIGMSHPLHHIQFLPRSERQNLMGIWSGLQAFDAVDRTDQLLQELFEETARKFPDRIAIECSAPSFRSMTYAQMSRRTNQLANWMRNNGVSVGSYVGMWLPRGMEVYIALIAILKAGAAYVPIDSEYPSDRVNFICDDCKAPVLITHSELLAEHPDFVLPDGCQKIEYDQVDALLEAQDTSFPSREITGQTNRDVCYVIYTSGSTGRPKGCQLEHRSAVNLVRAERILFGVHEHDRVYQGFSIAFDASVEEVWLAFASGAALVAATPDMLHAGPGLPAMLNAQRITIVSTVPTLLSMMEDTLPDIRILISGGEAVQKDIIKRWSKGRRFVNTYGPTECCLSSTPVIKSNGEQTILGKLRVGDELYTEGGQTCVVLANEPKIVQDAIRITDARNNSYTVDCSHTMVLVWTLAPSSVIVPPQNEGGLWSLLAEWFDSEGVKHTPTIAQWRETALPIHTNKPTEQEAIDAWVEELTGSTTAAMEIPSALPSFPVVVSDLAAAQVALTAYYRTSPECSARMRPGDVVQWRAQDLLDRWADPAKSVGFEYLQNKEKHALCSMLAPASTEEIQRIAATFAVAPPVLDEGSSFEQTVGSFSKYVVFNSASAAPGVSSSVQPVYESLTSLGAEQPVQVVYMLHSALPSTAGQLATTVAQLSKAWEMLGVARLKAREPSGIMITEANPVACPLADTDRVCAASMKHALSAGSSVIVAFGDRGRSRWERAADLVDGVSHVRSMATEGGRSLTLQYQGRSVSVFLCVADPCDSLPEVLLSVYLAHRAAEPSLILDRPSLEQIYRGAHAGLASVESLPQGSYEISRLKVDSAQETYMLGNSVIVHNCTVIATHIDTDPAAPLVTIGRAVPSYFLYILDADLNPCPVGVAGELHIGGLCVARGYLNRPDLTAEKFIPFPVNKLWNESPDEEEVQLMAQRSPRLYKAGDLCRWTEDGEVEFCGRIDQQVKLRGFRVELSEIESVLMTQPNIQSSVVSVREDVPGIQNLIGYVILKDPALAFSQDDLKEGIRVRLPPYMIPACIEVLTKFPTLPSGKVNRKELPPPKNLVVIDFDADPDEAEAGGAAAGASSSSAAGADAKDGEIVPKNLDAARAAGPVDPNYFPPRSPLEKKLAQMWRKLFQRAKISTTDDFFTLGGHSLLAAWLVSALRKDAATEHVTMADVYGFPKLRDMACKLSGGDPADLPEPAEEAAMALAASLADVAAGGSGVDRKGSGAAGSERKDAEDPDSPGDGGGDGIDLPMMSGGAGGSGGSSEESGMDPLRPHPLESFAPISNLRFIVCGFFQLLALYFLYALPALQIGVPWELYLLIREGDWTYIVIMLLPFSVAIFPVYVLVTLAAKWLLIGRYREGKHRLWGWYYFRWWIVQRLMYYCPLIYLRGSPVLNLFYKALGAKLGRNVFLNTHLIEAPDLVEIGEDTSVGIDAQITNFHVEGNWLYIRRVVIGKCCYVGARSVVSGGSVMCDHAQLGAMSLLTQGTTIPPWEHWRGSPALRTARVENYMARNVARNKGKLAASYGANGLKSRNGASNGKKKANGIGLNASDGDDNGVISSSLMENSDALYDSDGEADLESGPRMSRPKSFRGPSGLSSSFLGNAGLTEHLLSEDSQAQDVYVGVGEESLAWTIARPSGWARFLLGTGQSIFLTFVLPCMILLAIAPGMYLLHQLLPTDVSVLNVKAQRDDTFKYLAAAAPMALSFTLILAWEITVMKWMLIGQIQPGDYRIHSWFYLRKWCVDTLLQLSIQVIHPIYSTVLIVPWFRSLGAIVGERCEIATAVYAAPDLIEMGDECFIADTVYLGVPAVHMGTIRLAKISLGSRVFIGNGACLPMQTVIGNNCLVGVMSAPPLAYPLGDVNAVMHWPEPALRADHGTAWLGNPAMFLPNRQQPHGTFSDSTTYHPSFFLQLGRVFFELFKLTLPLMLFIMSMLLLLGDFQLIRVRFQSVWQFWLIWPLLYMSAGVGCCFVTLLVKWLLIGKYIAGEWPLWSSFIWRHDLVTSLLDSLVHPFFAQQLRGTPFLLLWFRLLGADIGSRVWLDSTAITEPDLVHIGDDTAIHTDAQLQTHLFEDRILKCSHLRIGKKCSIGNSAIVLYDSLMNEGSHLLPLSLLMKGESLPAWSSWQGVPAHQCRNIGAEAPVVMHQITKEELAGK